MVVMKGVTQRELPVKALLPAALDHSIVEGVVLPPPDDDDQGLYEPGPEWLEQAFDNAYDLIQEAEDAIDCLISNYANKIPPHQQRKLKTLLGNLTEFLRFYEGENV